MSISIIPSTAASGAAVEPPAPSRTPRPGGRSPLGVVFVTVFLDLVGFGIVIPLLPLYAERFGAGPIAVTWLVAVYSLMQFFFAPWWGQLSDRIGRRPVLLVGLFGSAISYLLFGLAASLPTLFLARALGGFMGANVGVAQAYIADVTRPQDRARGMGMIGAAFGLGFIFGPAIGGFLSQYGMAAPFIGAAILAFANGVLALFRLPESLPRRDRTERAGLGHSGLRERMRTLRRLAVLPEVQFLYVVSFLVTLALAAMEATFSLWGDRRWHFSPAEVAYLFAYIGVVAVVVQGALVGRLAARMGERKLALLGGAVLALGLAGIPLAGSLPALALALAAFAFGQGTVSPAISALLSRHASPREQGRMLGLSQSLSALGRVLGPACGGLLFARVGIAAPSLAAAALAVAALGVMLAIPKTAGAAA